MLITALGAGEGGKTKRSHVLDAMGLAAEIADRVIRVSFGPSTSESDVDAFADAWAALAAESRARAA